MVDWKSLWKKKLKPPLDKVWSNATTRRVLWGLIFFVVSSSILSFQYVSEQFALEEGQICPNDVRAPRTIVYIDEEETEKWREEAALKVEKIYREDNQAEDVVIQKINKIFELPEVYSDDEETSEQEVLAEFKQVLQQELGSGFEGDSLPDYILLNILSTSPDQVQNWKKQCHNLVNQQFGYGIKEEGLENTKKEIATVVKGFGLSQDWETFLTVVLKNAIQPNLVFDKDAYETAVNEERDKVVPIQKSVQMGQIIVREGDPVTASDIELLKQLGLLRIKMSWSVFIGLGVFIILIIFIIFIYLYQYKRHILGNDSFMILYGLLLLLTIFLAKVVFFIEISSRPEIAALSGYLIPLASGTMLIAILLDTTLAVFSAFILSIFVGMITGNQLNFALVAFAGSLISVYSVSKLSQRSDLAKAGFYTAAANLIMIIAISLIEGSSKFIVVAGVIGIMNGIFSSILTIGTLPYLESAFGITTSVRLLELSNPNQPVLKRLLLEAPGTYHHSILVGNLAEAAAEVVKADALLVRVGAYYHDIGKLKRPYFFIENQLTSENPHDKLASSLSTLIITSHIKDGLEIAREYDLPKNIMDIIEQHHGTGLLAYFYHRALEKERAELVQESNFRYDGPKPQTKEAALVMLADSVEAGVRALQNSTPGRVEGTVRKIIKEKLNDGQLDECDLTFKDLNFIASAFSRVLSGIFHSRIEYPDTVLKEMERRKAKNEPAD